MKLRYCRKLFVSRGMSQNSFQCQNKKMPYMLQFPFIFCSLQRNFTRKRFKPTSVKSLSLLLFFDRKSEEGPTSKLSSTQTLEREKVRREKKAKWELTAAFKKVFSLKRKNEEKSIRINFSPRGEREEKNVDSV